MLPPAELLTFKFLEFVFIYLVYVAVVTCEFVELVVITVFGSYE